MMKSSKKRVWSGALLVLSFVLGLLAGRPAAALETASITIANPVEGFEYQALQIMKGDYDGSDPQNPSLSNITWGSAITALGRERLGPADKVAEHELSGKPDVLKIFIKDIFEKGFVDESQAKLSIWDAENKVYTIGELEPGYYLIRNTPLTGVPKFSGAFTEYIMRVLGNETAVPKSDTLITDKKVLETDDTSGQMRWQDYADCDTGDKVRFRLTATLPSNYSVFDRYQLNFHDAIEPAFEVHKNSFTVTYQNPGEALKMIPDDLYELTFINEGSFKLEFSDLKALPDLKNKAVIAVEYDTLFKNDLSAVKVGSEGNFNTSMAVFSNDPYVSHSTARTPTDGAFVFTYKLQVDKVCPDADGEGTRPLAGAEFRLYKKVKKAGGPDGFVYEEVLDKLSVNEDGTSFTFSGLDAGSYKLEESKTPQGYNSIDAIEFDLTSSIRFDEGTQKYVLESLSSSDEAFSPTADGAGLQTQVMNKKGTLLPSTGGIGLGVFYGTGSLLTAGAFILAARKGRKRRSPK